MVCSPLSPFHLKKEVMQLLKICEPFNLEIVDSVQNFRMTTVLLYCVIDTAAERATESRGETQTTLCVEKFTNWERNAATEASTRGFPAHHITGSIIRCFVVRTWGSEAGHNSCISIQSASHVNYCCTISSAFFSTWCGKNCYTTTEVRRVICTTLLEGRLWYVLNGDRILTYWSLPINILKQSLKWCLNIQFF